MIKCLALLSLSAAIALAQLDPPKDAAFTATKTTSLSAAAEVITVQHTANDRKTVVFKGASLYCSVSCTITLERDGTAASTTVFSAVNTNPSNLNVKAATSVAYSSSNVGVGTVLTSYAIGSGGTFSIDLTNMILPSSTAANLTFRTNSITGTVIITVLWYEN